MSGFDPKQYLADNTAPSSDSSAFDPNAYLSENGNTQQEPSKMDKFLSLLGPTAQKVLSKPIDSFNQYLSNPHTSLADSALSTAGALSGLPGAGYLGHLAANNPETVANMAPGVGMTLGASAGPGGATLGGMIGQSAKDIDLHLLGSRNAVNDTGKQLTDIGIAGLEGAGGELAAYGIGQAVKGAAQGWQWLKGLKNAASAAEEAGNTAQAALDTARGTMGTTEEAASVGADLRSTANKTLGAMKGTSDDLYAAAKGFKIPLSQTSGAAQEVLDAQLSARPGFEPSDKLIKIAKGLVQGAPVDSEEVMSMQSVLRNLSKRGDPTDQIFAAKLAVAMRGDLAGLSQSSDPIAQTVGNHLGDAFKKATDNYRTFSNLLEDPLVDKLQNVDRIEALPKIIFGKGFAEDVYTAKAVVGGKAFDGAKRLFTNNLLDAKNLTNTLDGYSNGFLNSVYTPAELTTIKGAAKLLDAAKAADVTAKAASKTLTNLKWGIAGATTVGGATAMIKKWALSRLTGG